MIKVIKGLTGKRAGYFGIFKIPKSIQRNQLMKANLMMHKHNTSSYNVCYNINYHKISFHNDYLVPKVSMKPIQQVGTMLFKMNNLRLTTLSTSTIKYFGEHPSTLSPHFIQYVSSMCTKFWSCLENLLYEKHCTAISVNANIKKYINIIISFLYICPSKNVTGILTRKAVKYIT